MSIIGVLSDIHANISALKSATKLLMSYGVSKIFVCGDVVGYGENPNECCEELRRLGASVICGNHDMAVAGCSRAFEKMSEEASLAVRWTREVITEENLLWLKSIPAMLREEDVIFVHAVPLNLNRGELAWPIILSDQDNSGYEADYVNLLDVFEAIKELGAKICFAGHSHVPFISMRGGSFWNRQGIRTFEPTQGIIPGEKTCFKLNNTVAFVDVGSVSNLRQSYNSASFETGQDQLGSMVIFDTSVRLMTYLWHRY